MADSLDISVSKAREIVLSISHDKGWVEPELRDRANPEILEIIAKVRRELGDTVETIARDIYSRKSRFILELIQNAEDCRFDRTNKLPSLSFEVHPERIVIESNEDGFTENDVHQICRTGKSWKRQQRGYVGEKGIGFKSVFQVASKVHIQSNSFSFSFEYHGGATSEDKLGIITPIPEDDPIPLHERPLTRMTLTPNNTRHEERVAHFEMIHISLLLFLSKIKEIRIAIHRPEQGTTVTIFRKSEDTASNLIYLTRTFEDEDHRETVADVSLYYIFKTPISGLPDDEARPEMNESEVVLAFPVDNSDHPLRPTQHDTFAFLPVGTVGLNFLVQADFILQASREEVMFDSYWNKAILKHIANSFCNAVYDFCRRDSPLRYQWVKFLPVGRALEMNQFWNGLSSDAIELLKAQNILYLHGSLQLRPPGELRTLPRNYLDRNGSPLFRDRPGRHGKYLSLEYDPEDIETLKLVFNIPDIEDLAMCYIIEHDLRSRDSRIKSGRTEDDWHSRAARLILSILGRSRDTGVGRMITEGLPLIPLNDGRWVCASENNLYFPSETEPAIPQDIMVTICPRAVSNTSRKVMFQALGATECQPGTVVDRLWVAYLRQGGASNLASSIAHLSYLYWNYESSSDPKFSYLWIYDSRGNKVTSRRKVIYLPSENEYGPQELFRSVQYPRGVTPECSVSFANVEYMEVFTPSTRRHELSWLNWLKVALGVRDVPRLKFEAGSLSTEFRHILRNRPDKIIGTLKTYWATYRTQINPAIEEEISTARVTCLGVPPTALKCTYFPVPHLKEESQNLGILRGFPFLDVPGIPEEGGLSEDWRFLERFQVRFQASLTFYLDILSQHESQRQKPWGDEARDDIMNTYAIIADHCSENNKRNLVEKFDRENLILDPCSFLSSSTGPSWIDTDSCVWTGPENLLDKTPLASVPQYRANRKITRLFHDILDIKNANWNDYKRTLSKLKANTNTPIDITDRVLKLYRLFSESNISDGDWEVIRNNFESEGLVYVPSTSEWFPPSQCLWSSPVSIDGKAVVGSDYPVELRNFFLMRLQISPASLTTLVEGLRSLSERNPSVANIKQMIHAINAMDPKRPDLDSLKTYNILPIGMPGSSGNIRLKSCQGNFAVVDRAKLADIFKDHVELLAFSLEEVHQLDPFLQALGLNEKFLSQLCREQTACSEVGVVEESLTVEFKDRAYDFLRCAVSNRSALTVGTPQLLYDRLLATSVLKTDSISAQYTLHHPNGDTTGPVSQSTGYVHIRDQDNGWQIFVPRDTRNKEVCYKRHLPEALTKLFQIPTSAREVISHVLNSSSLVIDDLLEAAGIGRVPDIEVLPRRTAEEPDEQEEVTVEDVIAPERASRAHSAPLLTTGIISSQPRPSDMSRQEGRGPAPSVPTPQLSPEPVRIPTRSPSPAYIPRQNIYGNVDAYRELLDHVIRIASRADLPPGNFQAEPANGQFLRGFDHEAAFGIRSQNQMNHDSKIGAAGELFVFEVLLNAFLHSFNRGNWRSTIRKEVAVHPTYSDMEPWNSRETADIVYQDVRSQLTRLLIQHGYLDNVWSGARPEYLIEVKTTTGDCNDRFFMSSNQYRMMQEMVLRPGQTSEKIYVLFRVFNLGKENMNMKIYIDPETHRRSNALLFEAQTWTVTPGP